MASVTVSRNQDLCRSRAPSKASARPRVAIIGAGIAGLSAAVRLAGHDYDVTLCERSSHPGGKIRQVAVNGQLIDAGPTVLTMRWVFDRLFSEAGASLDTEVRLREVDVLCRHAWQDGSRLDLFADRQRSFDAIASYAGRREAEQFLRFAATTQQLYRSLEQNFIDSSKPTATGLAWRMACASPANLLLTNPLASLWQTLGNYFSDPRLRQLFGRYATYAGASPFSASSTLMLIAHVEEAGVWTVDGGMFALAKAIEKLAQSLGVTLRYSCEVDSISTKADQVAGLHLANGEFLAADAIVMNGDCEALASGLLGKNASRAIQQNLSGRSLSAIATALVGDIKGWPLTRHNVCFSNDYRAEFDDIFTSNRLPRQPTVYICAQDRAGDLAGTSELKTNSPERALILVNAPANGDRHPYEPTEIEQCWETTLAVMKSCGLEFAAPGPVRHTTSPSGFHDLFPATGGAIYGRSSHGWAAAFRRPGNRTAIHGLYLAGGSVHPGAGVPMAALSGHRAAASLMADRASTRTFHQAATSGGISTH